MAIDMGYVGLNQIWNSAVAFVPNLIAALVLLLIGWLVGKIVGRIVKRLLVRFKADKYFKLGRGFKVSNTFDIITRWAIYLAFIQSSVQILGVASLALFFGEILSFVGGLLEAMVIIIVGYFVARYVQKQVSDTKVVYSGLVGQLIFFLTVIVVIALALPFVGIKPDLINNIILIIVGSIGVGVAIALGFGLQGTVEKVAKKYAKKL